MGDAGFFRGTSSEQDSRFADKEKKLMKQLKFEDALARKINMSKINLDVIKPWITAKINEILGMEDDVVVEFIMTQLEQKNINPKLMQINITGFLNARCARIFMGELWELLAEADEAEDGIPKSLVDKKMAEMKKDGNGEANDRKIIKEEAQGDWNKRYNKLSLGRYTGPTREKGVRDDRIVTSPPRRRRSRSKSPKRNGRDRSPDRRREGGRRREDDEEREAESKRREEERIKRHAEQRRREEGRRDRRDDDRRRGDDSRDRKRDVRRRRSRSRDSPVRRRFTENEDKRRRSPADSDDEEKKKKRSRHESDDEQRHERKEKKEKKHKKEKKKKDRKKSTTPSSGSDSE